VTPTNGALMAVLLAAGVPYERWIRFVIVAALLCVAIGVASIAAASMCDAVSPVYPNLKSESEI
jgi:uncharacterized ion transporter superfamily protein YfcC